jgi:hypothetical protein
MATEVKSKQKNGETLYQLRSTISDELLHDEKWVTEKEAKRALMTKAFWDFTEKIVEIDKCFPSNYRINDEPPQNRLNFAGYLLDNNYYKDNGEKLDKDFQQILKDQDFQIQDFDLNDRYSEIEAEIIKWNIDGTQTAGTLTRNLIKLLNVK